MTIESLPELMIDQHGTPISTVEAWRNARRPELLEIFRKFVYGRNPIERPTDLTFAVTDTQPAAMNGQATRKMVEIRFAGPHGQGAIHLALFIPNRRQSPARAFVTINMREPKAADPDRIIQQEFWPAETLIARGYAAAVFHVADLAPDKDTGCTSGVHAVFDNYKFGPRPGDAWATIAAWAWGASRVMDYLETDPDIDAQRVALVGHSRGGKTALWCGAQDERYALTVSNESGCTGAALARHKQGETIKLINTQFPYWFCGNYKQFNDRDDDLPFDQHMLLALIVPRALYVSSAAEDTWSDPGNEFLACVSAQPAWRLYHLAGLGAEKQPPLNMPLQSGMIGYHIRTGKHDMNAYDWNCFMNFADRVMPAR